MLQLLDLLNDSLLGFLKMSTFGVALPIVVYSLPETLFLLTLHYWEVDLFQNYTKTCVMTTRQYYQSFLDSLHTLLHTLSLHSMLPFSDSYSLIT